MQKNGPVFGGKREAARGSTPKWRIVIEERSITLTVV